MDIGHYSRQSLIGLCMFLSGIYLVIGTTPANGIREPIVYYVQEELPAGHVVGHMIPDADLSGSYSLDELTVLQYKFIASPSGYDELFNLTQDGTLLTATEIDRDLLCPMEQECILSLDIEITPIQYFQIIKVNIVLLDINDNEPEFEESVIYLSLSESTPVGSVIPIPMAYDPDSPENGIDHYQLRVQDATARQVFGLKANGDLHDLLGEIYLEVLDHLDREEKSRYFLEIVAFEGHQPDAKQTVLLVHVSVTDVNDNMPEFSQSKYTVRVPESISVGTPLVRVTATDLDSDNHISYALSSRTVQTYALVFTMDNITGEIFIREPLDFERENQYNLVVVASDNTDDSLKGETIVSIEVTDVNDNAPVITVTSLGSDADHIQVEENADPETPLAHISVMDPDQGLGGIVTCELNDTRFGLSQMYANDFMLQATERLDREMISHIDLKVACQDGGNPPLIGEKIIAITVADVNDNNPEFEQDRYRIITSSDLKSGDNLTHVNAADRDIGQNADIRYSIQDYYMKELFAVNELSGMVSTKVDLPNHIIWEFNIIVTARDMGDIPLSSTTTLVITSTANRRCPNDDSLTTTTVFHIKENGPQNITFGRLPSSSCLNSSTSLFPLQVQDIFTINTDNSIIARSSLDREIRDQYCFSAVQMCHINSIENNINIHFHNIQVIVDNQNDNAPNSVFPNLHDNTVVIHESLAEMGKPFWIAQVKGQDADDTDTKLTYTIENKEQFPHLWLDPDTGDLFLVNDIPGDISSRPVRMKIRMADNGSPSLSTTAYLWVNYNVTLPGETPVASADNIAKVLGIAVPCGLVVVLAIVLIVLMIRKKFCCQRNNDRNHVNPSMDIKLKLAGVGSTTEEQKLDTLCKEMGMQIQPNIGGIYTEREIPDYTHMDQHLGYADERKSSICGTSSEAAQKPRLGPVTIPPQTILSSRDSDSGCSADMSHSTSTTDSWATSAAQMMWNKDNVDKVASRTHIPCIDKRHYPHMDRLDHVRSVPNDYVHLSNDGEHYSGDTRQRNAPVLEPGQKYADQHCPRDRAELNYDTNTYIRPEKVLQYGHINNGYQQDDKTVPSRDNSAEIYCPVHAKNSRDSTGSPAPLREYVPPICRPGPSTSQSIGDVRPSRTSSTRHSYNSSDVRRNLSRSLGTKDDPDGSDRSIIPDIHRHTSYTGPGKIQRRHSSNNSQGTNQPKKKKVIYEAQV